MENYITTTSIQIYLQFFIQHLQTRKAVKITRNTWQYKDITENAEARGDVTE